MCDCMNTCAYVFEQLCLCIHTLACYKYEKNNIKVTGLNEPSFPNIILPKRETAKELKETTR